MIKDYIYEKHTGYWRTKTPTYRILETVNDSITSTVWHKLSTNIWAENLIRTQAHSQWELRRENTGKDFLWVTEQLLTLLHIQGFQKTPH